MTIQNLTRMIAELPDSRQSEVRDFVESLWAKSRREAQTTPVGTANRRVLHLLEQWKSESNSDSAADVLDDFDDFQAAHPLRFALLSGEP